ncbi:hypothetical protein ZIOFF_026130 [Zingiber officinale]|uniref:Serine acetyltransferase N-terminal domain-containing protein n=1 Tax=Zingiber officinale TaxID=94328 RepID=A0A8J5LEK2_ZINOF|nr:hypothetical protein ZIOFF_026130 [Zingiber officinale]
MNEPGQLVEERSTFLALVRFHFPADGCPPSINCAGLRRSSLLPPLLSSCFCSRWFHSVLGSVLEWLADASSSSRWTREGRRRRQMVGFRWEDATGRLSSPCMQWEDPSRILSPGRFSMLLATPSGTLLDPMPDSRIGFGVVTFRKFVFPCSADKEQILSSFLYASVLSHDCLERALGFVLSNRLQNATLLATQLMDIFYDVMKNDRVIQRSIRLDAQAFKDRDPACASYSWAILYLKANIEISKGYHSLQSYRIAHALWNQGRKILALALQSRISEVFAVDIHPAARIGEGILLDHGTGLVIGETAVVGNWVSLMQASIQLCFSISI